MKKINHPVAVTFLSSALVFPCALYASDGNHLSIIAGMGGQAAAKYSGSNETSYQVLPYFELDYGNWSADTEQGVRYNEQWDNGLYFSQGLGYSAGRAEKDSDWQSGSDKLKGMGNIKAALNSTTTLGWSLTDWMALEGSIIAPLTDSQGMQYTTAVKFGLLDTKQDAITITAQANFGDARYNNLYYGVSFEQSQSSGYQSYKTSGGLYSIGADINWQHYFTEKWAGYLDVKYTHLSDKVSDSSIVFRKGNTEVTAGFLYTF